MRKFNKLKFLRSAIGLYFIKRRIMSLKKSKWISTKRGIIRKLRKFRLFSKKYKNRRKALKFKSLARKKHLMRRPLPRRLFKRPYFIARLKKLFYGTKSAQQILSFSQRSSAKKPLELATALVASRRCAFRVKPSLKIIFPLARGPSCRTKRWNRLRFFYKNALQAKRLLQQYFDRKLTRSYYSSFSYKRKSAHLLTTTLLRPEFRLDVLLWRARVFKSPYAAENGIKGHLVTVNEKVARLKYVAKAGDVVSVKGRSNYKASNSRYILPPALAPFVEVDYYSNEIVVLFDCFAVHCEEYAALSRLKSSFAALRSAIVK